MAMSCGHQQSGRQGLGSLEGDRQAGRALLAQCGIRVPTAAIQGSVGGAQKKEGRQEGDGFNLFMVRRTMAAPE